MRCRVQNVTSLPNGTTSTKDREVTTSGNRLRIGRGTDNDIVLKDLAVALRHADIVVRDFDIVVESVSGSLVLFDDVAAGRGALTPETVVGHRPLPDPAAAARARFRPGLVDRVPARARPRPRRRSRRQPCGCGAASWPGGPCRGCCSRPC